MRCTLLGQKPLQVLGGPQGHGIYFTDEDLRRQRNWICQPEDCGLGEPKASQGGMRDLPLGLAQ